MNTSQIGETAAQLMDDIEEEGLPEDAEVDQVALVVRIQSEGEEHIHFRSTSESRIEQVGLFTLAAGVAQRPTGDEED